MHVLDQQSVTHAVLGGALLGGGGGGRVKDGRELGMLAVQAGMPRLVSLDELPDDGTIVTVSAVGAPAAKDQFMTPMQYTRAVQIFKERVGRIDGLISCENGGLATVNGWFQAAVLGIPVVDAPANGRAHPIGLMGSMGLHRDPDYLSSQAACGGDPQAGRYVELSVTASLPEAARIVRQASIAAGGLIGVARNPVSVAYARQNAAAGAISLAIELGRILDQAPAGIAAAERAAERLGGSVLLPEASVKSVSLETVGGFDVGAVELTDRNGSYELTFWNEYMTLERGGERLGTFPDLLATIDLETRVPIPSADITEGMQVALLHVPGGKIPLGGGMRDPDLYRQVEEVLKKDIRNYITV
ncbi:MAG: DUF917 family protein [Spirochaetaceae bacterium]|nr:MAG: DUF917 family protein [Spirochaetaceae bacterium]